MVAALDEQIDAYKAQMDKDDGEPQAATKAGVPAGAHRSAAGAAASGSVVQQLMGMRDDEGKPLSRVALQVAPCVRSWVTARALRVSLYSDPPVIREQALFVKAGHNTLLAWSCSGLPPTPVRCFERRRPLSAARDATQRTIIRTL